MRINEIEFENFRNYRDKGCITFPHDGNVTVIYGPNGVGKEYSEKGGISLEEWSVLQGKLKEEEDKREKINSQKKMLATEILPFIIVSQLVEKIPSQLREEKEFDAYKSI